MSYRSRRSYGWGDNAFSAGGRLAKWLLSSHVFLNINPILGGKIDWSQKKKRKPPRDQPPKRPPPSKPSPPVSTPPDFGDYAPLPPNVDEDYEDSKDDYLDDLLNSDSSSAQRLSLRNYSEAMHGRSTWKLGISRKPRYAKLSSKMVNSIANIAANSTQHRQKNLVTGTKFGQISSTINEAQLGVLFTTGVRSKLNTQGSAFHWEMFGANSAAGSDILYINDTTVDLSTIEGATFRVSHLSNEITFRNNWTVPATLELWYIIAKKDMTTASLPDTIFAASYGHNHDVSAITNGPDTYDEMFDWQPASIPDFLDSWTIYKHTKKVLGPGDQSNCFQQCQSFNYESNHYDLQSTNEYIQGYTRMVLYRIHGVLGHNAAQTDEVGITAATLDWIKKERVLICAPQISTAKTFINAKLSTFEDVKLATMEFDLAAHHGDDAGHG